MPKLTEAFHVEMEKDDKGVETGNYVVVTSSMYEAEAQQAVQKFPDEWFASEAKAKAAATKLTDKWAKDKAKFVKAKAPPPSTPAPTPTQIGGTPPVKS